MKYRYNGPLSGLNLAGDAGEVVLINGQEYDLHADNRDVQRLVGLNHLTPLETPEQPIQKGESDAG
ncbi:hypothetical protein NH8B_0552 [Pseudogulbenkiania sp. NH8B]|uniref:hypothetical protein n=1 Tax=Pseudogulbenkiania sp. (strain NH8B) TaxID=748280 RepID=UPI00022794FB|nr:hypothetical protein [Pseudogulbenkiania sp. NH8B]BAK75387.1 hypothetical protein NH8B_0552 [Pseudogulbenkiania sp. NH8B]